MAVIVILRFYLKNLKCLKIFFSIFEIKILSQPTTICIKNFIMVFILPEFLWCLIMRSQKLKFVRFEEVSNLLNIIFKHTVHCILSKTRYCQKKFWGKWRTQFSVKSVIKSFPYVENLSRHTVYVLFSICLKKNTVNIL